MKSFNIISIILVFISLTFRISAQEIKVTEFRSDPRDISARENTVFDANGDACALIKTRSGLQNLKFSCDLGIIKIENHEGEYWLWVSPNTKQINIEAEGIGKLEYKLPAYAEEYKVYVIFLTATLPDKIIYKNINSIKIETKPKSSEIYIDKTFMGFSPMNVNVPSDTFQYEIRGKRYATKTGNFIYSETHKNLFVTLNKDPAINRMFLVSYLGYNKYRTPFPGLQFGTLGKTGWYISFVPPIRGKESLAMISEHGSTIGIIVNSDRFMSLIGDSSVNYTVKLKEENSTFYNNARIKIGLTQRILKNTYLLVGLGLAQYKQYYRLEVIPNSSNPSLEIPLKKTFYGESKYWVGMFCFETGFIYRISNAYLINLNISTTGLSHYYTNKPIDFLLPLEGSIGFGYNF